MGTKSETLVQATSDAADLRGVENFLVENSATVVFTVPTSGTVEVYSANLDGTYLLLGTCDVDTPAFAIDSPMRITVNKSASAVSAVELWKN